MDHFRDIARSMQIANQIALTQDWQELASQTLEMLRETCQAEAALLYQPCQPRAQTAWAGRPSSVSGEEEWQAARAAFFDPTWFAKNQPQWVEPSSTGLEELQLPIQLNNLMILPYPILNGCPGGFLLLNCHRKAVDLASLVAERMASELDKAALLAASLQREQRMRELNEILGQLGASLDPNRVLRMFIDEARKFLHVEAISLFLIDEETGELVLTFAGQEDEKINVEKVRVPAGKGIIGFVTTTGETVLVEDARNDPRHYGQVDQSSGFQTRSILAVPLRTRTIDLGEEYGTSSERIIGGLEAINKIGGRFQEEDKELLLILAKNAATIMVVAQLYEEANNFFLDTVHAIVAAIDAKDPYTQGHSRRVSAYSVEIAREMGFNGKSIYQTRLGSLFHDVGKLGIPDSILLKKDPLTEEERTVMCTHPKIGERILGNVRRMKEEIPAMTGHHEWMNGRGYPRGLSGSEIPIMSRIVAVADVFDALTSERVYRAAMPTEDVFALLRRETGTHFDAACVEALISAYNKGRIHTQSEPGPDIDF